MAAHIKWSFVESLETVSPQFAESKAKQMTDVVCNDQVFGRGCLSSVRLCTSLCKVEEI